MKSNLVIMICLDPFACTEPTFRVYTIEMHNGIEPNNSSSSKRGKGSPI